MQTIKTCNLSDEYKHVCFKDLEDYIAIDKFVDVLNGYSDLELAKIRQALQVPNNIKVDDVLNPFSTNPVENDVIYDALTRKADINKLARVAMTGNYDDLNNTPCKLPNPDALVIKGYGQPIIYDGNETVVLEIPTSVKDLKDWELVHIDYDKIKSLVPIKNIAVNNVIVPPNECGVVNLQVLTLKELNDALADLDFPDIDLEVVRNMINQAVGPTVISYIVEHMDDFKGNDGATGQRGPKGDSGKSAYQSYLDTTTDDPVLSESEWIESLHGADGTVSFDDLTDEQKEQLKGDPGPQGPAGPMGPMGPSGTKGNNGADGRNGIDGKSAYELAVGTGYPGSLEDWLDSLKGLNGEKGDKGDKGDTGPRGEVGPQGPQGLPGVDGSKFNPEDYEGWDQVLNLGRFALTSDLNSMRADLDTYTLVCKGCDEGDEGCTQCEDAECTQKYGGKWGYKCSYVSDALLTLESQLGRAEATLEANTIVCDVCKEGYDCTDEDWTTNPEHFECRGINSAFADFYTDTKQAIADIKAGTEICWGEGAERECINADSWLALKSRVGAAETSLGAKADKSELNNYLTTEAFGQFRATYDGAQSTIGAKFTQIEGLLNDKLDTNDLWTTLGYTDKEAFEQAIQDGGLTQEQIDALNNLTEGKYLTSQSLLDLIANEEEAGAELRAKFLELTKNNVEDSKIIRVVSTGAGLESVASAVAASNALKAKYASQDSVTDLAGTVSSHTTSIASLTQEVNEKASKTELSSYYKKDNTDNEAIINLIAGEIGPDGEIGSRITISADAIDANTSQLVLGKQGEDHNNLYGTVSLSTESVEYIPRTASSPDVYLGAINLGIDSYLKNKISNIDISDWTISEFDGSANSPAVIYPELEMSSCSIFNNGISNMATGACIPGGINMNPVEGIKLWAVPLTISDTSDNNYEFKAITDNNDVSYLSIGDSLLINSENTIINNKLKIAGQVLTQKELHTGSGSATIMALVINNNFAIASDGRVGVVVDNNGSEEFRSGLNLSETGYNDLASFINSGSTQAGYTVRNGLIVRK